MKIIHLNERFDYFRLTFEERMALWCLRHLFYTPNMTVKSQSSMVSFLGPEALELIKLSKNITIDSFNDPSCCYCNDLEINFITILRHIQLANNQFLVRSYENVILENLSAILALKGLWLQNKKEIYSGQNIAFKMDVSEQSANTMLYAAE
ncbi:hypothetical protein [Aristophania vespae]|uniref:hypothetical protein n=1 Tax=Aristophania vespae TaxID=2697033 RepID=UPI00235171F1|nr:hypothetical protein [Aristophania vespae]UMM63489.1 hypothetical protein DM15PD_04570 [Aristophania vespae]